MDKNKQNETLKNLYEDLFMFEVEGNNVEDAIEKALKQTKLNKDEISLRVLTEGSPGLFGLRGDKPAKVLIAPKFDKIELWVKTLAARLLLLTFLTDEEISVECTKKDNILHLILEVGDSIYKKFINPKSSELLDAFTLILEIFVHKIDKKLKLHLEVRKI